MYETTRNPTETYKDTCQSFVVVFNEEKKIAGTGQIIYMVLREKKKDIFIHSI